jgi:RNA polymerase-binding transcription factor DksA
MDKKTISVLKKKLEQERILLEKDLLKFADKDKNIPDDYDTRFPDLGGRSSAPDEDAKETETYENLLAVEYALELRLKEVNGALKKIKEDNYGNCEICKKNIQIDRLKANAAATVCMTCNNKKKLQKEKE